MNFMLDVISPKGILFSGEVKEIIIPTSYGQLAVLAKHMPLASPLKSGKVKIITEREKLEYNIVNGFLEVQSNLATLLVKDL